MTLLRLLAAALPLAVIAAPADARGFLRAKGTQIVDGQGQPVVLRGMGLGGWMLQEGYMLQLGALENGQQHVIRREIAKLIGEAKTQAFYQAWLDNHMTKADVDAMADAGFNSIRLPMHYNLLTLPVEEEPVAGRDTWHEQGFARIDRLLEWSKANGLYLILDLHAAPGGQGTDLPIADRDPAKPSLWESPENQRKTIALWRRLAERYKDEPWIGGYDLINEPNWDFDGPGGGHGCQDKVQAPLRKLQMAITAAIREVDRNHLIVAEGNCWGNNYAGVLPPWDDNLVLSFHKYWNVNTKESIAGILRLRDQHQVPVWLGESGENSNVWFRDAIALVEREGIGWAFWPWKKIGFNQPLEIAANPGWQRLVDGWLGKGPMPSPAEAEATLMRLATHDIRFENNIAHPDVIDAMLRQPHEDSPRPFKPHRIGAKGGDIAAVDYDLGPAGVAYRDLDDANYHVSTGKERTLWNNGRTYRNDGVDIARRPDGSAYVDAFQPGEWLRYGFKVEAAGRYALTLSTGSAAKGALTVALNGGAPVRVAVERGRARLPGLSLAVGNNHVVIASVDCACTLERLSFTR